MVLGFTRAYAVCWFLASTLPSILANCDCHWNNNIIFALGGRGGVLTPPPPKSAPALAMRIWTSGKWPCPEGGALSTRLWIGVCSPGCIPLPFPDKNFPPFPEKNHNPYQNFGIEPGWRHTLARLLGLKTTPFPDRNREKRTVARLAVGLKTASFPDRNWKTYPWGRHIPVHKV